MVDLDRNSIAACAAYIVAFMLVYFAIGTFDWAADAAAFGNSVEGRYAERSLSAIYDLAVALGLLSLWVYGAKTWVGGALVGALTSVAAGGLHVAAGMAAWLPAALAVGFIGGFIMFAIRKRPGVSALLAMELALAVFQVVFLVGHM